MGTKTEPGIFDCYTSALPDEEMFVLLARDPDYRAVVEFWMARRIERIVKGEKPFGDVTMLMEASHSSDRAEAWRKKNDGKWRYVSKAA